MPNPLEALRVAKYVNANVSPSIVVNQDLSDSTQLRFGTGNDITMAWDGTDFDILPAADDSVIKVGNGTLSCDFWVYGGTAADNIIFDASANTLNFDGIDVQLEDADILSFGDADDVQVRWDGTDLDVLAAADDSIIKFGNGTESFDIWAYGNTANAYLLWDASGDTLSLNGPARPQGFNALSPRFELKWVAGQRGKPGVNGDILSATEATREIADPDFEVLGTNAVSGSTSFYAEGGILLTTAGAQADSVIIAPHLDANQTAWTQVTWGTDKETVWECLIQTTGDITNTTIWAGLKLTNTPVTATDDDQAFFRYETGVNTGKWQAIDSIGGTDNAADSGVTVAINTTYHLKIVIASDRTAKFYINGVLVSTSAALTDTVDLIPYIGVAENNTGATAETLRVFGQAISRTAG